MRGFNLSEWAVRHPPLILFLILALSAAGVLSYTSLGRSEDPSFTIKVAIVTVSWDGATAKELQDQVVDKIEKKLHTLPYFDYVQTYTIPGFAAITVSLRDNTPARQVPELLYQLRKKLDDLKPELPAGIKGPNVNDEFGDVDSVLYAITAPGQSANAPDYEQLKQVAEGLGARSNTCPARSRSTCMVSSHSAFGWSSATRSLRRSASRRRSFDSLARQNAVVSAGTVETNAQHIPVRVTGALDGVKAVAETPVQSAGTVFRLGDIATVTRGFVDPPDFLVRQESVPGLIIGVVVQKGANILEVGERLKAALARRAQRTCRVRNQADRRPAARRLPCGTGVHALLRRGTRHRSGCQLPLARLARRHRRRDLGAAGARGHLPDHEYHGYGSASDHARRADHRSGADGRRCDHRGRDDGGEDG